ncbi:PE-PGRS family protein [Streptomyces gamaensis]|uniref:PE-PGRS family protein n=1 Tax=Streptomyces gamaensis TaxID=1763542 RepID=A0ABW0Z953_9ACTN
MRAGQPYQGPRALRAAVFAVVCVLLAALGHAVMSATTVPWWAVAVALTVTGSGAWAAAGRERGPLLITLATVGAQTGLHFFFAFAQDVAQNAAANAARLVAGAGGGSGMPAHDATGMAGMPGMSAGAMSGHAGHAAGSLATGGMPDAAASLDAASGHAAHAMHSMGSMAMHHGHGALGMWSAHVLVAAVCGIWLSGGEQAAFRLARTLRTRLFRPLLVLFRDVPPRARPPRLRADRSRAAQRLRQLLYAHVLARRGPPARAVVVG